jgi:hypothetical protein
MVLIVRSRFDVFVNGAAENASSQAKEYSGEDVDF